MTRPIAGTHAAAYLAERGITDLAGTQGQACVSTRPASTAATTARAASFQP